MCHIIHLLLKLFDSLFRISQNDKRKIKFNSSWMEDTLQLATREKIETDEEEKTFGMKDHKEEKFLGDKREKCEQQ